MPPRRSYRPRFRRRPFRTRSRYKRYGTSYRSSRKRFYRRRMTTRRSTNFPRIQRNIFPSRIQVKLNYYETVLLASTEVAAQAEYVFNLNSLFDPNQSGTGSQPRGFDQWASMYSNYLVKGVAYRIKLRTSTDTDSSSAALSTIVGMTAGPEGFSAQNFSTITDYIEYPRSKYHRWRLTTRNATQPSENAAYNSGQGTFKGFISSKALQRYYGSRGIMGVESFGTNTIWPTDFSAPVTGNPASLMEICLWAASLPQDGSGSYLALPYTYADVLLTYYAEFWGPKYPTTS